jgi:hypothetical protein
MHCLEMGSEYFLHKWSSKKHVEPEINSDNEKAEKKPNNTDDVEDDEEEHTHTLLLMSDQSNWV